MEQVLAVYQQPYNEKEPVVCFDETNKQLIAAPRSPCNLVSRSTITPNTNAGALLICSCFRALGQWRHVTETEHRTKVDFAHCMKALVDEFYPEADRTVEGWVVSPFTMF